MLGIIEELLVSDPLYPQVLKKRTNFFFTQLPTYVAAPSATDIQGPLRWTREIGTQRLIVLPESMGTRVVRTGQYHRITHPLLSTIALDPVQQHAWTAACDVTREAKLSIQHVMELGWKRTAVSGDLGWVCSVLGAVSPDVSLQLQRDENVFFSDDQLETFVELNRMPDKCKSTIRHPIYPTMDKFVLTLRQYACGQLVEPEHIAPLSDWCPEAFRGQYIGLNGKNFMIFRLPPLALEVLDPFIQFLINNSSTFFPPWNKTRLNSHIALLSNVFGSSVSTSFLTVVENGISWFLEKFYASESNSKVDRLGCLTGSTNGVLLSRAERNGEAGPTVQVASQKPQPLHLDGLAGGSP